MKQSAVVAISHSKGAFLDPPYLDAFGEPDPNMRRGKPLTLSPPRYERLQALYTAHGIPDEIRRISEQQPRAIDWMSF